MGKENNENIESLSFETALSELETLTRKLESGEVPLEEAISIYERGAKLKAHCENRLKSAQMRVDAIVENSTSVTLEEYKAN